MSSLAAETFKLLLYEVTSEMIRRDDKSQNKEYL